MSGSVNFQQEWYMGSCKSIEELNKAQAELKEIQQRDRKEWEASLQQWIDGVEQKAKDSN
jgi:hypothetical protein